MNRIIYIHLFFRCCFLTSLCIVVTIFETKTHINTIVCIFLASSVKSNQTQNGYDSIDVQFDLHEFLGKFSI